MKIENFKKKWHNKHIKDDGYRNSKESISFMRSFNKTISSELEKIGLKNIDFGLGHYYFSGFAKTEDNIYVYYSYHIRRNFPFDINKVGTDAILIRIAQHESDYKGEENHFGNIYEIKDIAEGLVKRKRNAK